MEYEPKWIVASSDDMYIEDQPSKHINELKKIYNQTTDVVFTYPPDKYHSEFGYLAVPNRLYRFMSIFFLGFHRTRQAILSKFLGKKFYFKILTKPNPRGINGLLFLLMMWIMRKKIIGLTFTTYFFILSAKYILSKNGQIYDSTYINGYEDIELALSFRLGRTCKFINYKIGDP